MKTAKLVQLLEEALLKRGFKIRNEKGNFRGGRCVVEEERMVILNRRFGDEERAEYLGRALSREPLDELFLLPEVREYVERFVNQPMITLDMTETEARGVETK
ncbi:hypothetical protein IT157_03520 [bacterium]|nr:hypothetical protein [bacterium]